jgi:hypothetical protein
MRFTADAHARIANGEITRTYRAWKRPQVKVGGRYHVGPVDVVVDRIDQVRVDEVSDHDARRSGFADQAALAAFLRKHASLGDDGRVWRVEFQAVDRDSGPPLAELADLSEADVADIRARLDRMDARSETGPWTRATLELIRDNPAVVSTELAAQMGRERAAFKTDVRKLKRLGLTISLEVGYQLSPRGEAFLRR